MHTGPAKIAKVIIRRHPGFLCFAFQHGYFKCRGRDDTMKHSLSPNFLSSLLVSPGPAQYSRP